jgi:UDP-GlcNAc:undecaprenyl-phosphate GlcNAc-1-phosphate transferase
MALFIYVATLFLGTIIILFLVKKYAGFLRILDIPNARSIHQEATPKGGGVALYTMLMTVMVGWHDDLLWEYLWVFVAISLIFLVGLLDDIYYLSPKTKFLALGVATVLLSVDLLTIQEIGTLFGMTLFLGWLALPFTIFVVAGFTNAMNLIDGLDGLAGSIALMIFLYFLWIGYRYEDYFIYTIASIYTLMLLGFLLFNWYPASIFMGDSGSLVLGFVISILAIKSLAYTPAVSILYVGALPIIDTMVAIFRRYRLKTSLFRADNLHLHHLFYHLLNKRQPLVVVVLVMIQMLYIAMALWIDKEMEQGYFLLFFLLNILFFYKFSHHFLSRSDFLIEEDL